MQAALVAAVVTVVGWYVTYAYARRRDDQTRRIEIRLKYRQRQIEELYGPLLSLIEQIFNVWQVRTSILDAKDGRLSPEQQERVSEFIWKEYFSPLHQEIATILRTKLYLLEGGRMPPTFARYLEHATREACQHRLWSELQIETSGGTPWPQGFYEDVKNTLDELLREHQGGLQSLQS
jgi:hypothetical protein